MNEKLRFCAPFKAFMILLVILGHSCIIYTGYWSAFPAAINASCFDFLVKWLDTFHTYAFVFVSGYIFYNLKYVQGKYDDNRDFIKKKFRRLIIPYGVVCAFWAIPIWVIVQGWDVHVLTTKYLFGENADQLWFLLMLFWVFVLTVVLLKIVPFDKLKWFGMIGFFWGGTFLLYIFSVGLNAFQIPNLFRIISALEYEMYFVAGMIYGKAQKEKKQFLVERKVLFYFIEGILVFVSLFGAFLYNYRFHGMSKYLVFPFCSFSGILFFIFLVQRVCHNGNVKLGERKNSLMMRGWNFLVENSFYIYLIHQQLIYLTLKVINIPNMPPMLVVVMNFIIALLGSGIIWTIILNVSSYFTKR